MGTLIVGHVEADSDRVPSIEVPALFNFTLATSKHSVIAKAISTRSRISRARPHIRSAHVLDFQERGCIDVITINRIALGIFTQSLSVDTVVDIVGIKSDIVRE